MWCIFALYWTEYRREVASNGKLSRFTSAPRWTLVVGVAVVLSLAGALGIVRATNARLDTVARVPEVLKALSPSTNGVENYLLVGSDSRASAEPTDADFASTGTEEANPGMRSDTLIVVRYDTATGAIAMMSIPRDLWVRIGDTENTNRINAAYQKGPDILVRTVQNALNIPIHHFVEVNFSGFKKIVDSIGGVRICVDHASRDKATGFFIGKRGCKLLNGAKALGYARSRHFEQKVNGRWQLDGSGDVGRGTRQRGFMATLAKDSAKYLAVNPLATHTVLDAFAAAVKVDPGLDLIDLGRKLRPIGSGGAISYSLPVSSGFVGDKFVFRLANEAQALIAFFSGVGPAPAATK